MTELATFGAGCFWGVEETFRQLEGVIGTEVGYAGGEPPQPTYQEVCGGDTGHAEVIRIEFNPAVVSYEDLLEVFWAMHDPTTKDRQGLDIGTQYRSVIFCHSEAQKEVARASKEKLDKEGRFKKPIVTLIEDEVPFYRAEDYHQRYIEKKKRSSQL